MNDLLNRFIVAVENIGNALQAIAATSPARSEGTALSEVPVVKPTRGRGTKADPEAAKAADTAAADAKAAQEAADKAAADKAAAAAKDEPGFDYEKLKKAIIDLASEGEAGKAAAVRVLTDAGLEKGKKASDAPKAKWEGMYNAAIAELAKIKEGQDLA